MRRDILGLRFDALSFPQALEAADALCRAGEGGYIVTANPELILRARTEIELRQVVDGAALVLADGVGVLYAADILGTPLPERVSGSDLVPALLPKMAERGASLFLYGGKPGVAERAAAALKALYPGLRIAGTENGYISDETALLERIQEAKPELLLVALGAPRQERWMAEHRALPCLMIGVGGLLDVFARDIPRAPIGWQKAGLEWLYRLYKEPRRLPRMVKLPWVLALAGWQRLRKR